MAHLILHDVDPEVMEELRRRADLRGRDIETEAKTVLEDTLGFSRVQALVHARRIRGGISRGLASSAGLLRAERERR